MSRTRRTSSLHPHREFVRQFLSPADVATELGCTVVKVWLMLSLGSLDGSIKLGKYWRIPIRHVR